MKCAALLHVVGEATAQVYISFEMSEEVDSKNYNKAKQKFQEFCEPMKNLMIERYAFFTIFQKRGETIDQYVIDLKNKSWTYEFGTSNDRLIKDRIVFEIISDSQGM